MKIHYISCHSTLEYDEVKLLTELGYEVYSNGAYRDPKGAYTLPRPGIPNAPFDEEFFKLTAEYPKTNLPPQLIDPYDVIIIMHSPEVLYANWDKIKHKRVILRTIGQNTPSVEAKLLKYISEGLQVIRYSPMEQYVPNYAGATALIRFYKDPEEFKGYVGGKPRVMNNTQSLLGRRYFCHYDEFITVTEGFDRVVYGPGNDDLGSLNGGDIPFDKLKQEFRDNRVYFYGGTWPAPYTLSFIEAWMTGIPVVAIGRELAEPKDKFEQFPFYEIPQLIHSGVDGYVSDSIDELRIYIDNLIKDEKLAKRIGEMGRTRAMQVFGKNAIAQQWKEFLGG